MIATSETVLRGATWEHPRGLGSVAAATAVLGDGHGIRVVWTARSLRDFGETRLTDLARDNDLLVIDHPHVSSTAAANELLPLDLSGHDDELVALRESSVGASYESYRYGGRQYGLPIDAAAQVSLFRPDLLDRPPTSWAEVLSLAGRGRVRWPWKAIDAFSSLITVARAFGWRPSAGPWGTFPTGAHGAAALTLLHRLAERVPEQDGSANPIDIHEALSFTDQWWYSPLVFGYSNYSREGFRPQRLRVGPPPSGPAGSSGSLLGGAGIAVSAHTAHPEAAIDVALHLASGPVQSGAYFEGGGQPAHADAWTSEELNGRTDDFFLRTRSVLESATVRPKRSGWVAFQDLVSRSTHAVLANELTDDQYWSEVRQAQRALLNEP